MRPIAPRARRRGVLQASNRASALRRSISVAIGGLVIAFLLGFLQQRSNDTRVDAAVELAAERIASQIQTRIGLFEYGLRGARGSIVARQPDPPSRSAFSTYMATRDLEREFPGALGFGYIARIDDAGAGSPTLAQLQDEWGTSFRVQSLGDPWSEQFVLAYFEPLATSPTSIGLDLASESRRRNAAIDAARSGEARLTAPLTLSRLQAPETGVLLYLPVYAPRTGAAATDPAGTMSTDDQRWASTIGWTVVPIALKAVLDDLADPRADLAVRIRDGAESLPGNRELLLSADFDRRRTQGLRREIDLYLLGRHWDLEVATRPAMVDRLGLTPPWLVSATIATLSVLIAALFGLSLSAQLRRDREREDREARTQAILDASPQAVVVVDRQGVIVRTNARVRQIFGHEPEALIGQSVDLLVPPELREAHVGLRSGYDGSERFMADRRHLPALHADGHRFYAHILLKRLGSDKDALTVVGVIDVTAETVALERAQANETRWRELANAMPQLVWTCGADGVCDFLSVRWLQYTGIAEEQQLGAGWLEQVHPVDRMAFVSEFAAAMLARTDVHCEMRIRGHDGSYRWFDTQVRPQLGANGQVLRWVGSNTDIEDRRRAEDALRELNATLEQRIGERTAELDTARRDLHNILDALPSLVSYWDAAQRNGFANQTHADWLGIDPSRLPGTTQRQMLGEAAYAEASAAIDRALAGESQVFERRLPHPDGRERHLLTSFIPDIVDDRVAGFYELDFDITELRAARAAAEAANTAKSAFLANMSHEIRTPMNAVLNLVYLLERSDLDADQRDTIAKINLAARSLMGVINDILDLSKIEAGEMPLAAEAFDLPGLVENAVGLMDVVASEKGLRVSVRIGEDVPTIVRGDALRVTQILNNLLSNAIKFTHRGGVSVKVARAQGENLRITVEDTGIGIAANILPTLFHPFTQADESVTRRYGGTGLGLALVARLAEAMGGSAGAESEPGEGSRFWFELPLPATALQPSGEPRKVGLDVLLVDDDREQRRAIAALAHSLGWRVAATGTAGEAIERIAARARGRRPFDLVLLDWKLPEVDGLSLLSMLRRGAIGAADLPVIVITAHDREVLAREPDAALADALLAKPLHTSQLFDAAHAAIVRRRRGPLQSEGPLSVDSLHRLSGARLLLVDDSEINLEVGRRILEREGASVTTAGNGREAIERITTAGTPYDLVLLDIQMPVMDGYEACRHIREVLGMRDLPVFALTAGALVSERERAFAAGVDDFISKPFEPDSAVQLIAQRIGTRATPAAAPTRSATTPPDWPPVAGVNAEDASLRLDGDVALFARLLRSVLTEYADLDAERDPGADPEARLELSKRAHKLSGISGALGAIELSDTAAQLQARLRDAPEAECASILRSIRTQLDAIRASVDADARLADMR